jgi:amino acid adenylation domain-containing protein
MTTSSLPGARPPVDVAGQQRYWHEVLSGDLPVLRLTPDYPRPPVSSFLRAVETLELDQSLYRQLLTFCAEHQCSLNVVLLTAYSILLHRYTGEDDILIGSVASDCLRGSDPQHPEHFTNLLALRTYLAGNPDFLTLLSRTAKTVAEADRHRDYPFEQVLESVSARQASRSPAIIHNLFALCRTDASNTEASLHETDLVEVEEYTSQCDFVCVAVAHAEKLTISCHYDAELFASATILRVLGHYRSLLGAAVTQPETAISALPLLTEAERHQLLVEWNDTKRDYPQDKRVHQLFEEQAEKSPDAIAVVFENQHLTYRELNIRANQFAQHLQRFGVGPEVLVGLCIEHSIEMMVGMLGILKAGGAYVPFDPTYPCERLAFMLEDAQVAVLVTQAQLLSKLPAPKCPVMCMDNDWEVIAQGNVAAPTVRVTAENLAYVIYTSGSTGTPKGVMIPHRGLSNYLTWCLQAYPVAEGQGAPVHSSLSFDLTVTSVYVPLLAGRTVYLLSQDSAGASFSRALKESREYSLMKITPAHLQLLGYQVREEAAPGRTHAFIIGGEALLPEQLAFWKTHYPQTKMINEYGPTETVVGCCVYEVQDEDSRATSIPIGRPISNTQLYILDQHRMVVPIGVPGELYIGGEGLARGYLNQPELTAEKFIPDPFSTQPGARLYRTGDLARYLPDGNLEFLGRIDTQVKLRGFRIELGEIEAILRQHPVIRDTVVVLREDTPGDKRLVACLVLVQSQLPTVSKLRGFLQSKLPDYMVPSAFVFLDTLPLTANGKIDRKALPRLEYTRPDLAEPYRAARTPTEELLVEIWTEVFKVERVGVHDNFFELGGHSLLATMVIARINQQFPIAVPLRSMFEFQTIAALATLIDEQEGQQASHEALDRIFSEIETLSEKEAETLLMTGTEEVQRKDSREQAIVKDNKSAPGVSDERQSSPHDLQSR